MYSKKLSVIIPVYKAAGFIKNNLNEISNSFSKHFSNFEIIAVIDGNQDHSYEKASEVKDIRVVGYAKNRGKGYALKYGYQFATGDYITFLDCDMDLHPDQLLNFYPYLSSSDMVIGSKRHPFSKVKYPLLRRIMSEGFRIFKFIALGLPLKDTQTGMKLIKKELLDVIMPLTLVKRYAFDVELCFLAKKHGFRIVEAPVQIKQQFGSTVHLSSAFKTALDVLAISYRYHFLHYYQKKYWENRFRK